MKTTRLATLTAACALIVGAAHMAPFTGLVSEAQAQSGDQGSSASGGASSAGSGNAGAGASASGGASAQGQATAEAARDPNTSGLEKAIAVVGTTPASESEAPQTLAEALERLLNGGGEEEEEITVE